MLVSSEAVQQDEELCQLLGEIDFPAILFSRSEEAGGLPRPEGQTCVTVPDVHMTRAGQVKAAVLVCLARGLLQRGDRVVCLAGVDGSGAVDGLLVLDLGTEPELFSLFDTVAFAGDVAPEVFERTLCLATQLAAEGREGRPVGTLFILGDSERVLAHSRNMVLNPFQGHPESERNILDPALEDTIKEFAALDGAFVVRGDGVVLTAGSQLLSSTPHSRLPGGLGTRHAVCRRDHGLNRRGGGVHLPIHRSRIRLSFGPAHHGHPPPTISRPTCRLRRGFRTRRSGFPASPLKVAFSD